MASSFPLHEIIATWIPRVTGSLSILGSSAIIYMMIRDRANKLIKPSNRILLAMSCIDIPNSLALAFSTAPIPKEYNDIIYGAIGSDLTCNIQAFFIQMGFAVPYYNASLCAFYLLTIKYNRSHGYFRKKVEPYLHAWSLLYPLATAIVCLSLGWFGHTWDFCWINIPGCYDAECRHMIMIIQLVCSGFGLVLCFLFISYSLVSICLFYRKRVRALQRYNVSNTIPPQHNFDDNGNETAKQAIMFTAIFLLTYGSAILHELYWAIWQKSSKGIGILTTIFLPLQGFWNFLIYIRPLVIGVKENYPNCSIFWAISMVVAHPDDASLTSRREGRRARQLAPFTALSRPTIPEHPHDGGFQREDPEAANETRSRQLEITDDNDIVSISDDDKNGDIIIKDSNSEEEKKQNSLNDQNRCHMISTIG